MIDKKTETREGIVESKKSFSTANLRDSMLSKPSSTSTQTGSSTVSTGTNTAPKKPSSNSNS